MGTLKKILEKALLEAREPTDHLTEAFFTFQEHKKYFEALVGNTILWKAAGNQNPQLVKVEKPYDHFVLVSKTVYNSRKEASVLYYGINYASVFSGHDRIDTLEVELQ